MQKLVIFLKAPRRGTVKTRLAAALGPEAALAAYRELVERILSQLRELPPVELRFTPDDAREEIQPRLAPGWSAASQGPGDLGTRLTRAFADAFAAGAGRVVVIGSDCPEVTAADIREAWTALGSHDLVLGPAHDGGYWLVGLRRPAPELFADISWSTASVFEETLARARSQGLGVRLLRTLRDVDTPEDWEHYRASHPRAETGAAEQPSLEARLV